MVGSLGGGKSAIRRGKRRSIKSGFETKEAAVHIEEANKNKRDRNSFWDLREGGEK